MKRWESDPKMLIIEKEEECLKNKTKMEKEGATFESKRIPGKRNYVEIFSPTEKQWEEIKEIDEEYNKEKREEYAEDLLKKGLAELVKIKRKEIDEYGKVVEREDLQLHIDTEEQKRVSHESEKSGFEELQRKQEKLSKERIDFTDKLKKGGAMWITNSNKEKRLEVEKKQIKGAEEEMKKGLKKKERITKRVFDGVLLIIFGSFFLIGKGAKGVFGFLEKWSGGKK